MLDDDLDGRIAGIRSLTRQHFVKYDAETVDVRTPIDLVSLGLLGTHVERTAQDGTRGGKLGVDLCLLGNTEVAQ